MPNLIEVEGTDTNDMSTIIKKFQDILRNRLFLINELEKFVKLLLLSQATYTKSEGTFSASDRVKSY